MNLAVQVDWENRGIRDAEAVDAPDPELRIHNGLGPVAHAAGARGMKDRIGRPPDVGANVGIRQLGAQPLVLIISYPIEKKAAR